MRSAVMAYGACGTKWLARELDRSPTWEVKHEPAKDRPTSHYYASVRDRFALREFDGNYCEVNPRIRYLVPDLKLDRWCILIRDPREQLVSAVNRHPVWLDGDGLGLMQAVCDISAFMAMARHWEAERFRVFRFEDVTASRGHVLDLAHELGITDLDSDQIDMSPVHGHGRKTVGHYEELPWAAKNLLEASCSGVMDVWGYQLEEAA